DTYSINDFFFQAEDGIRDFHVTGVQTCALPILLVSELSGQRNIVAKLQEQGIDIPLSREETRALLAKVKLLESRGFPYDGAEARSEERRVGKEWRRWWWRERWTDKGTRECRMSL